MSEEEMRADAQREVECHNSISYPPKDGIDCPLCLNRGTIAVMDEDGENYHLEICKCKKDHEVVRNARNSGLGRYLGMTGDDFKTDLPFQKSMRKKAALFMQDHKGHWFAALGTNGTGKTTLTVIMANKFLRNGNKVIYKSWPELARECDVDFYKDKGVFEEVQKCEILLIDDFLKSNTNDRYMQIAYEILNHRYNHELTTLISCEKTIQQITKLDPAIGSRIAEMTCQGAYLINNTPETSKNQRIQGAR